MIRVNFNKPTYIKYSDIEFECMFCFPLDIDYINDRWTSIMMDETSDGIFIHNGNIQSIEHVKPTDL